MSLAVGSKAGVGQYCHNLVQGLAKIDQHNKYVLFPFVPHFVENFKDYSPELPDNFKIKYENLPKEWIDLLFRKSWLPGGNFFSGLDLFHATSFIYPNWIEGKVVSTIHDVSFKTHPQYHKRDNIAVCHQGTVDAVKKAEIIIAISNNTKTDLVNYYNCNEDRIVTIYSGVEKRFRLIDKEISRNYIKEKYNLNKPFLLSIGTIEPRKNIQGLISAYSNLDKKYLDSFDLVIVGGRGWLDSDIYKQAKGSPFSKNIKFTGYIDDADLPYFYNAAEVFIFPSFYEGFGLPILESMACGCPVISSNTSSMPEVGGDAPLYINPRELNEIKDALESLIGNKQMRENMRSKGLLRANLFSLDSCAKKTLKVYSEVSR